MTSRPARLTAVGEPEPDPTPSRSTRAVEITDTAHWACATYSTSISPSRRRTSRLRLLAAAYADPVAGRARVEDIHALAMAMPHVTVIHGSQENPIYQVGSKSFIFFRTPRPDAIDPHTGERYPDVIVFWVASEADKQALVQDRSTPFFTTAHFDGHASILIRATRIHELSRAELAEHVQDAWLARASPSRAAAWLRDHGMR